MSVSFNQSIFIGRLTKEAELRYTPNGKAVANFSLAVSRDLPNAQGDKETDFFNCVIWGKPAENLVNTLSKGDLLQVVTRAQNENYEKNGQTVYATKFVVEGFPKYLKVKKWENGGDTSTNNSSNSQPSGDPYSQTTSNPYSNQAPSDYTPVKDDDLPF